MYQISDEPYCVVVPLFPLCLALVCPNGVLLAPLFASSSCHMNAVVNYVGVEKNPNK